MSDDEEEEDVHICGLCRAQFSTMEHFVQHKKLQCPVRLARRHKHVQHFVIL